MRNQFYIQLRCMYEEYDGLYHVFWLIRLTTINLICDFLYHNKDTQSTGTNLSTLGLCTLSKMGAIVGSFFCIVCTVSWIWVPKYSNSIHLAFTLFNLGKTKKWPLFGFSDTQIQGAVQTLKKYSCDSRHFWVSA